MINLLRNYRIYTFLKYNYTDNKTYPLPNAPLLLTLCTTACILHLTTKSVFEPAVTKGCSNN